MTVPLNSTKIFYRNVLRPITSLSRLKEAHNRQIESFDSVLSKIKLKGARGDYVSWRTLGFISWNRIFVSCPLIMRHASALLPLGSWVEMRPRVYRTNIRMTELLLERIN